MIICSDAKLIDPTQDTCVVSCHFNFIGWKSPVRNFNRFIRQCVRDEIPLFGAEAYLDKPESPQDWIHVKAEERNICFQKESLLNIAIKNLPPNFTKIIVCDHDIFFERKDWFQEASKLLDQYDFVQPFSHCSWTGPKGEVLYSKYGIFYGYDPLYKREVPGHPGFAIGFTRKAFSQMGGLYPFCIVGGGDVLLARSIVGNWQYSRKKFRALFNSHGAAREWFERTAKNRFTHQFIHGHVFHEFHGRRQNRDYVNRNHIVLRLNRDNIFIGENGLVEISDEVTLGKIKNYLKNRNEDGV